jgi:[protein-PII] uridylyltransferase
MTIGFRIVARRREIVIEKSNSAHRKFRLAVTDAARNNSWIWFAPGLRLSGFAMATAEKLPSSGAALTLAERSERVDRIVTEAAASLLAQNGVAVLAVGGYGRRHLFPHSDVDVLILFESERLLAANKESVAQFLQTLWDSALRVSHSVRTLAECLEVHEQNTELNVSLLDQRYLAGDRAVYAALAGKLPRFIHGNREALIRNLARLARQRHAKYANTIHHLEPNVKESPGGLRDYQLVRWLGQLRQQDPERPLEEAFLYLRQIRCFLHGQAGRDANVLSFDSQDAIAEQWYDGDAALAMREYYRHARTVYRAALQALEAAEAQLSSLFSQFRDWRGRLENADFSVHHERAHFRAPLQLETDPNLALRLFEFTARHGILPSVEAERQIESRLPNLRRQFAESQPLWADVSRILSLPHAPIAVRAMHESGVLMAVFPELDGIDCLVIRDFYHRYTVDEHTLVAMKFLSNASGNYEQLRAETDQSGALMFALLFHDSGKSATAGGHVETSVSLADVAMARLQAPRRERDFVRFLIGRHLELSAAMQARDLSDPQTVRELAARVETVERLKALTLLTYADIGAVNPEAMNSWRAAQLWQLYLGTYNELTRGLESSRIETVEAPPARAEFLKGFPTRYLSTHTDAEIDHHLELDAIRRQRGVAVELRKLESAWQLTLLAADRPGLFASAAGTLAGFGMNILRAEAFSNRRGLVLDTFLFADPNRTLDLNPSEVDQLRSVAERVTTGKKDVRELLKNRPKPKPPSRKARIPATISINPDASATATLIEIVAEDRPGLLYDLASAISGNGANIEVVLVDTEAHKAIDVFYVTAGGKKLEAAMREKLVEEMRARIG